MNWPWNKPQDLGFKDEKRDLLRGVAGALITGIPLIYTMEMWNLGLHLPPKSLIGILIVIFFINVLFSFFAGFRESHSSEKIGWAIEDAVTAIALSLVLAGFVLFLLGRIDFGDTSWHTLIGEIILQASTMSVGVTFTNIKFTREAESQNRVFSSISPSNFFNTEKKQLLTDFNDLAATIAGATVFALNVAPTEEIVLIASTLTGLQLLAILCTGLLTAYVILFAAGILDHRVYEEKSFFQRPWVETILAYTISMVMAFVLLKLLGWNSSNDSFEITVASTVVLSLPAVVGGAAGRLIL